MATVVIGGAYDGQYFQSSEVIIYIKTFEMKNGFTLFHTDIPDLCKIVIYEN